MMNVSDFITIFSNPTITAIVGAIAGGLASFFPLWAVQRVRNIRSRNNIRTLIRIELNNYSRFLQELSNFVAGDVIFIPAGNLMITRIKQMMPENGKFKPSYYMTLNPEIKASVFNNEELSRMEPLYTRIHYLQEQGVALDPNATFGGFSFSADVVNNLITDIVNMSRSLE